MKIKLCRIWNVFNPNHLTIQLVLSLFLLFIGWSGTLLGVLSLSLSAVRNGILIIAVGLVFFYSFITFFPKEFVVEGNRMEYCLKNGTGRRRLPRLKINCRIIYTEGELELKQNSIEKLFDVGHLIYKGPSYGECTRYVIVKPVLPKKHKLYGITHFSDFKKSFEEYTKPYIK